MAKFLLYIRIIPVTLTLTVAAFIGTLWMLWPVPGVLWFAAIAGLAVFGCCFLIEAALVDFFTPD